MKFAESASARARDVLGVGIVGVFYTDALQHKIVAALKAVDVAVASGGGRPLLVPAIVPGFDLLVCKRPGVQLRLDDEPVDPRAALKLDANTNELLGRVAETVMPDTSSKTFAYQSTDGVYYFAFRSAYRAEALEAIGILPDELSSVDSTAGKVLQ
ncbi:MULTISPECIES: hypothetical protein [Cupriavidus]